MIFKSRVALYYQNNGKCRILFDAIFGKMFNHDIMVMYVFVRSSCTIFISDTPSFSLKIDIFFIFFLSCISVFLQYF